MREILFRGKRKDNGEWVESSAVYMRGELAIMLNDRPIKEVIKDKDGKNVDIIFSFVAVEKNTVSQFIGITDKYGKNIFEGDIVKMSFFEDGEEYPPEHLTVYYDEKMNGFLCHSDQTTMAVDSDLLVEGEVIGNIYDNPELLEE